MKMNNYLNQGMLTYLVVSITFIVITFGGLITIHRQLTILEEMNRKFEVLLNDMEVLTNATKQTAQASKKRSK